ncbi:MAG TPA: 3'-5' exonuclease, partial [Aggregatilineales bacterium]|nr:3'-5' exonuclease [Aggregatilineales bacterium]
LDTFINPQTPIPEDATRVHHITDDMVKDAPTIEHFREQILAIFERYDVYIYNAEYDIRLLRQSATGFESITGKCVMKPFSELIGDWSSYHNNYKFQSLDKACRHYGVTNPSPHRALGDAISACRVHHAMLAKGASS